jgi:hypothetical protein
MKMLKRVAIGIALVACLAMTQGCFLFVVGAVAAGAAGTVSYVGNELHVTQEVSVDRAWSAANGAVQDMQFSVITSKTFKDATGATLTARNAKDQPVRIQLARTSDRLTEIRIRVGTFDTAENRAEAQLLWDKMKSRI